MNGMMPGMKKGGINEEDNTNSMGTSIDGIRFNRRFN
jgi:hypothetical protein